MSTQVTVQDDLRKTITIMRPQVDMLMTKWITAEQLERFFLTYINQHPELLGCARPSLLAAYMQASQLELPVDGKNFAILKYGDQAKGMPMVAGLMTIAQRAGVKIIDAIIVYEKDQYESWTDEKGPHFKHIKARSNPGEIVLTYAYAITNDDGIYFEEVTNEQMQAIENSSKSKNGPWKGPFRSEMMRKSAIKRLCKRLPSSTALDSVIEQDNENYELPEPKNEPVPSSSRLAQLVEAQVTKPEIVQNVQNVQNDQEPV